MDTVSQQAWVDSLPVELTGFEYKLLTHLLLEQGAGYLYELTEHLYAQDFDRDSNVVEVLIGRVRRKLGSHSLIQTVRGQGYRMIADDGSAGNELDHPSVNSGVQRRFWFFSDVDRFSLERTYRESVVTQASDQLAGNLRLDGLG